MHTIRSRANIKKQLILVNLATQLGLKITQAEVEQLKRRLKSEQYKTNESEPLSW